MKKTIIISALGAMFMASCADEFNTNNYPVDRPARLAEYAYLNDYQPLKSYGSTHSSILILKRQSQAIV